MASVQPTTIQPAPAVAPSPPPPAAPPKQHTENSRVVISGVSWEAYLGIRELLGDLPVRLTFSDNDLEIMMPSREHEWFKSILGRLIGILTEEMAIDMSGGGSNTLREQQAQRGLEPDDCFWIAHAQEMRGPKNYDPAKDPPPDLATEIEISRAAVGRLPIYASLRVPEVWRFDGTTIRVLHLGSDGEYHEAAQSLSFPYVPMAEVARFLVEGVTMSDTEIARRFRAWVRSQIASGAFPKPPSTP